MIEHNAPISGIASYKDKYISTAGYDNQVILWDAKTKTALNRGLHDHLANQCRFSKSGEYLITSSSDKTGRVWEVPSMRLVAVLSEHEDDVESIAISDDDQLIATCSRDHKVRTYSIDGQLQNIIEGHTQDVISVEWINNSRELISSSDDGTVKRWDGESGELLENIDLGGVETDTIVITKEGVIFAANDNGEIISISNGDRKTFFAHNAGIKRLVYSDQTNALVSLSYDRKVKVWHVKNQKEIELFRETDIPAIIWPRSCCFIGIQHLAFATFGSSYATLDLDTMEWDDSGIRPTHGVNAVLHIDTKQYSIGDAGIFKQDGKALHTLPSLCNFLAQLDDAIVTGGQTGEIFNGITGELIHQHRSPLNCGTSYQLKGIHHVAIGAYTGEVIILKNENGCIEHVGTHMLQDNAIKGIANDGNTLFTVSATGQAAWHDLETLESIWVKESAHDKIANGCATLQNDAFVSISRDLKLRIWDQHESFCYDTPHTYSIKCVTVSEDSRYICTGSYGGYVAIFDSQSRSWTTVVRPTTAGISCVTPQSDNNGFFASSYDGQIYSISV